MPKSAMSSATPEPPDWMLLHRYDARSLDVVAAGLPRPQRECTRAPIVPLYYTPASGSRRRGSFQPFRPKDRAVDLVNNVTPPFVME